MSEIPYRPRWTGELSPILVKEMRSTMRSGRTFAGLTLFLLFLAGLSLLVFFSATSAYTATSIPPDTGRTIFGILGAIELLMLWFIAPSMTTGAIAGEYQRQTFDMLMMTPLTPRQVLGGKLAASLVYLFLLMITAIPINSFAFLFGGIDAAVLGWWVALAVVVMVMLGTIGLMMSVLIRSMGLATGVTYGLLALLFVLLPAIVVFARDSFFWIEQQELVGCVLAGLGMMHPGGGFAAIIFGDTRWAAGKVLPATLLLYTGIAGFCFAIAEGRLAAQLGRRQRAWPLLIACLILIVGTIVYLYAVPVREVCISDFQ